MTEFPSDEPRSTQALAASERRLRFLDALAQATRTLRDPREVMQVNARMLGEHLGVNRCAYAQVEADQNHFTLLGDYSVGVPSLVGRYAFSDFGDVVLRLMRADEPYVNPDVENDPQTAGTDLSTYRATRIASVICLPLHKGGRFVAAMAVHQDVPRHWSDAEIALVAKVVGRCWETLERIRAEAELERAHARLALAMQAGELGDWSWDVATDLFILSDRAADIYGLPRGRALTRAEIRGRHHPDEREAARAAVDEVLRSGEPYSIETWLIDDQGNSRWALVRGMPEHGPDGSITGMTGMVQDITAQRLAREAVHSEAGLLELLNQTGIALAAELDLQALLQLATDAATRLTGAQFGAFFYNDKEENGDALMLYTLSGAPRSAFDQFGKLPVTPLFAPTFKGGAPVRSDDITQDERYGQRKPHYGMPYGHLPVRSYLAVPVVSRDGGVIGGMFLAHPQPGMFSARSERLAVGIAGQAAVAVDNARLYAEAQRAGEERRALLERERAARQEAERANATKDEFLATLSHELRTPLSAIMGWVYILRRKIAADEEELQKGVEVIDRNTRAQAQLIDDLLDMSRINSGKLRLDVQPVAPITFVEAAIETMRPAAEAAGVQIETSLDSAAGTVSGDPGRLQQIVWNLLANAVKFTPRNGRVQVRLERVDAEVLITVADTGIGIAADFLPLVFDRFHQADGSTTRKFGGLGLGLSIAKHLVELHGGRVRAASAGTGHGATFTVHLPLKIAHEHSHDHSHSHSTPGAVEVDLTGTRVLVVDDERDSRELLQQVLQDCGATVYVADGAESAFWAIPEFMPDVLVSDIGMPGMDGYELLRRLRQMDAENGGAIPAIALTAFARSEDRVRALRAGFAMHVAKPVEPSELVASIASVVNRNAG